MQNISGFGTKATIVALQSFPYGFTIKEFADDEDPITFEEIEPVGYEILLDGSLFTFDKGAAVIVSVSVIPGTEDDINLKMLLQSRKGSSNFIPLPDVTSMVIQYPQNGLVALSNGSILSGPLGDSIISEGRLKGNIYKFVFGSFSGAQSIRQVGADIVRSILG
ncbi:hypothetical protein XccvBFoX7_gp23 [Xanthomonas phage FoX7]|uniref:Uncharacterized protein n=2 Tax=Carpasinavirus XcP1 TaxID=2182344 RepID=A0A858NPG6_9CAUD|nr:putative structural protein [Xanthomonas phage FoX6]QJB22180.1 hypothetical protein XccvBFoX7_gp23 [Xanthomonas phage FoX7]